MHPSADADGPTERERIREILTVEIERLHERVETAWDDDLDIDAEQLQLKRLRTLAHLARQYRLVARDEDLDEMEAEIGSLQEFVEGDEQ